MGLKQIIIEKIKSEGPINFETFMNMCLYYPGLGYYTKDTSNIGRAGDFYTSPHLHAIFGAMIGKQMEEMWQCLGEPENFHVVETGAGMGYLAKDVLEYICRGGVTPPLRSRLKYIIVELNPAIRDKQRALLAEFADRIAWISGIDELPSIMGCFLSNELVDAFPVRIVEMDEELMEIYVSSADKDRLIEVRKPCGTEAAEYLSSFGIELVKGYRTEVNLRLRDWITQVAGKLSTGFVLTVDYGYPAWDYYGEDRSRGTLLCYYQHQVNENPYQNIGEQDLTAHVNFSALKRWGEESGLKTLGFCPQGTYLVSLGIDKAICELYGSSPDVFETARIKGLLLPQGMGESHKVMIQYKGPGEPELRGFALRNQAGSL